MWIVRVALDRPYTFIVLALLILLLSPVVILRLHDIFPTLISRYRCRLAVHRPPTRKNSKAASHRLRTILIKRMSRARTMKV